MLITRPSPTAYPGRNPGFDVRHFAVTGPPRLAAIATPGGGFIDLLTATAATLTQATTNLTTTFGPTIQFLSSSTGGALFSNSSQIIDSNFTIAIILNYFSAFAASFPAWGIGGLSSSVVPSAECYLNGNPPILSLGIRNSGGTVLQNVQSTISIPAIKIPCFCVVSQSGSSRLNMLIYRMDTAKIQTYTTTSGLAANQGGNGLSCFSNLDSGATMVVAAMAITGGYLTMNQMIRWAQEPWLFWYPRLFDVIDDIGPGSPATVGFRATPLIFV